MMIYLCKQTPPDKFCEGVVSHILFCNSPNGWHFLKLVQVLSHQYKFFLTSIPPTRPVLLIMDGHGTHMSIEIIELA